VVEETAALVVDDEQGTALELRRLQERMDESAMNAWPTRTSPCGCSSPEVPWSSSLNAGSTNDSAGSVPVAACS
jgi:hypothetical protein